MIIDAENQTDGDVLNATYCIIGAGPAGITLALELAAANHDVLLVESGGYEYADAQQELASGSTSGAPYADLDAVRIRTLGGTTDHWAGQSLYLDPLDFEERPFVPFSGWPIPYEDYLSYVPKAAQYCGLRESLADDDLQHGTAASLQAAFAESDFRPVALFYPEDGPRKFGPHFREEMEKSESLRVLINAPVLRLDASENGQSAQRAPIETLGGKKLAVDAKFFVLACGGIENSRMLLLSGPENGPGLGNQNDVVGRYFMEHPNYFIGNFEINETAVTERLRQPRQENTRLDFQLTPDVQREREILNHSAYLLPTSRAIPNHRDLGRLAKLWRRMKAKMSSATFEMLFRFEHAPNPDSRITLDGEKDRFGNPLAHVNFAFGALEDRTLDVVSRRFAEFLGAEQLGQGAIGAGEVKAWTEDPGWQIHHYGGCRMGNSPKTSVVDTNCRVHGMENLFIAGSAVFPTCGHANPTMNLVALALRLSDHLKTLEG